MRRPFENALWMGRAALVALALSTLAAPAGAVILDDESRVDVVLQDGTTVALYARAGSSAGRPSSDYYCLPTNLRLAQRPDGVPEFLFLKFTTEEREDQGGIQGALLHFLMTWGLTPEQEEEVAQKLKEKDPRAKFKGAVELEPDDEGGSFRIISATLGDEGLAPSTVLSGRAPLVPGGRAAAASRLSADGAQLLAATFEKTASITDLDIELNYTYLTLAPAARGRITIDWQKIQNAGESVEAEYKKWQSGKRVKTTKFLGITVSKKTTPIYSRSYDEMRREWDFLRENQYIRVEFDQLRDGETAQKMQEAFFEAFMSMVAQSTEAEDGVPPPPSDKEKEKVPDIKYGRSYKYKQTFIKNLNHRKTQVLVLNARTAVRRYIPITANLRSWYDNVEDNPKCVSSVVLNDPFFQHRDIRFVLDLEAKELFEEQVNYVTVQVQKQRTDGRPFEDHITIDSEYLEKNGVTAALTYARGNDTNPDAYRYKAQWSLRGGEVYPPDPPWQDGSWEGATLAPPVKFRTLEVEADLDELEAAEITRATVQVHYPRFGQEIEKNIHLSPARGEGLVSERIFTDRDAPGYAYRIILNHKRDGKLVLPWEPNSSDDYVFVTLPPELLEEESELRREAKAAAEEMISSGKEKILDRFGELLKKEGS